MNIRRKTQAAFASYLGTITGLAGLTIVPAHASDIESFPLCIVHCQQCVSEPDLPTGSTEFEVEIVLQLITQTDDDETAPQSDPRLSALSVAMRNVSAIQAALNCNPVWTDTSQDTRLVSGFTVKAIYDRDQAEAVEGRNFIDSLAFDGHVCDFDCDGYFP